MSDEEKTITIKKDDLWKYSTFALVAMLVIGGLFLFVGNGNSGGTGNVVANNPSPTPTQPSNVKASADDDPFIGDKNAPVTIIEFSDYDCPFCGRFYQQTLPQIKSEYIDTGKVKFVYRDFPLLSIHPNAGVVAEAAECVRDAAGGSDEEYFKMHDKIFDNPRNTGRVNLELWAQELGYDIGSCLDSGKFRSEVQKDTADAQAAGGRGTPYFVINGKPLSGAQPFNVFQQIIEAELA